MLRNLTGVADYRGLTFVECMKLRGRKYGVMFTGDKQVLVSPAVYRLLSSDMDAVAKSLKIHELPPSERSQWTGRKTDGRVLP